MKYKIVTDSSSNLFEFTDVDYQSVPLKIITPKNEYIDHPNLNVGEMLEDVKEAKGHSSTSSPQANDWLAAFGDADMVFGVTITSGLSHSFKFALEAKEIYEKEHPDRKVFIFDSLSTGPELILIVQKISELIHLNKTFKEIRNSVMDYMQKTHLFFSLSNLDNLARNGRIKPALAKSASALGFRVVGRASYKGTLEPILMCQGQKSALKKIVHEMIATGYQGGKVIISHTQNEKSAQQLITLLKETFGNIKIELMKNTGLCSYYAEDGGLLIGFES